jgi:hypothetical protein
MSTRSELTRYLENEGGAPRAMAEKVAANLMRRGRSHVAEMFTNLGATAQAEEDAFAKMPQRPPGPVRRFVVRGFDWWTRFCESKEEPQ